ncbi:hypothetical protein NCS56_00483600 [Fusarium sp. Ph1]|nr:hypothetical protein NCS56_00483600 [Fusarium sp. Ph1]
MQILQQLPDLSLAGWSAILLSLYIVYSKLIYPFLLSPVRHIPGPWYTRVSRLPLLWATLNRARTAYATRLLDKYGPVVVIAPDQVHTTDDSAMKIIYSRFSNKTSFYKSMGSWKGVTSTLGFVDYRAAAPSRNNLLQCFQNRNLSVLVENLESHVDEFIQLLKTSTKENSTVDGVVVFRLLALDIVTDSFIPALDMLVQTCGSRSWKQLRNDCNDMDITAREALQRWKSGGADKNREKDVLSMLQSMNSANAPAVPTEDIPAYMVEMLAAGSSTTSHTAAFACWLLTRHPDAQDCLRRELFERYPDPDDINIREMMDLPYLDGVIRETMRLYPMIPGPLERHLGEEIVVADKRIPKGVVASTAAYNQGRLEEVFPEPNNWTPERWIDADERMRLNWTPFGYGCRSCPGSNLAMTELKYMIGKIFRFFRAVTPPGHELDALELADVFAAGSKTGHVWLKFLEAKETI